MDLKLFCIYVFIYVFVMNLSIFYEFINMSIVGRYGHSFSDIVKPYNNQVNSENNLQENKI